MDELENKREEEFSINMMYFIIEDLAPRCSDVSHSPLDVIDHREYWARGFQLCLIIKLVYFSIGTYTYRQQNGNSSSKTSLLCRNALTHLQLSAGGSSRQHPKPPKTD
jgi:hypothetical protein